MHKPVFVEEAVEALAVVPNGIYIDGTFGRGGHAQCVLERLGPEGRLFAIDKDWEALTFAREHFAHDQRLQIVQGSFSDLAEFAKQWQVYGRVDGILLDLGVSSPQLDDANRGFSFMQAGPLDMRMDSQQGLSAAQFVNEADETLLANVFYEYGEERFSRRIARAIVAARNDAPIEDTAKLSEIVTAANPKWEKHKHPATRVFQAIRIHVNQELTDLEACLAQCIDVLAVKGRLAVISFHSLEDRIVKQFMQKAEQGAPLPKGIPMKATEMLNRFHRIGRAIKPKESELQNNSRARSAILRIGEKTA
ncbi:MAG: 16S rRNA (cytosine(1402)-N(4))-methyltransferase RsmH [Gammaproteobacteria bacterium]|nr:16S rRNA (cytosine(1402)-N(4))-methyltransferase RsmH [Gammaproteobacteria bacterium]